MHAEFRQFINRMPHFAFLPSQELDLLAKHAVVRHHERGTLLAEQGKTRIEHIYIVQKGQISIYADKNGRRELGGYIKSGEVFGGISLLMNGGISLRTVQVDKPTDFYLIPRSIFLELCERFKDFYEYFLENFSKHVFDPALATLIASGQARVFLSQVAPFSFLPEEAVDEAAACLSFVHHPKGSVLFVQARSRVGYLYILQKGMAERYYERDGRKTMHDILAEGDLYGGISMLVNDGVSVRTLEVTEDAYFYLLPKKNFLHLCAKYQAFSEFFTDTFGKRMLDRSYASIVARTSAPLEDELQLFNQPVKQLVNAAPVFGHPQITIQQAAQVMRHENSSYLIIPASPTHAAGILTDSDLARKVIASGYDHHRAAAEIMSTPLCTVNEQAAILEAMMTMMQHDIKHLPVTGEDHRIIGMLTNRELLSAQGQSPLFILRQILRSESLEEIVHQHRRLSGLVKGLISGGAKARAINRLVTTVSDAILKKVMEIVLRDMAPPPVPFVFMIMGSEGRGEQTLKTDQDNAIVFEDVADDELAAIQAYFLDLGQQVCAMLDKAGYAFCRGDVMARNPKWCQPLRVWKEYFIRWINAAEPEDLLQASIFFDFRGGYGDLRLIDDLRQVLFSTIGNWTGFLRYMTQNALHFKPPLGFFGNFVVEVKGDHRNAFDIKSAMLPIVDFARIYALKNSVEATNTLDRLHHLYLKKALTQEEYEELEKAYSFLMQLRLVRQVTATIDQKSAPDNFINPKKLTRIEQTMLKEIFKRIEKFQAKMNFDFVGLA
jgi:CBS domain-containing protein